VQSGTPLHALQELGGWSTTQMVQRYAHLSAEHLAEYANRLGCPRTISGTACKASMGIALPRCS
jgi:site-specific recombinase XerC